MGPRQWDRCIPFHVAGLHQAGCVPTEFTLTFAVKLVYLWHMVIHREVSALERLSAKGPQALILLYPLTSTFVPIRRGGFF